MAKVGFVQKSQKKIKKYRAAVSMLLRAYGKRFALIMGFLFVAAMYWALFAPQTIAYTFASHQACQTSPRLFPTFSQLETSQPFQLERPATIRLASWPIYSHTLCAKPQAAPQASQAYGHKERLFGQALLGHTITVNTSRLPSLAQKPEPQMVPLDGVLVNKLSQTDAVFRYQVELGANKVECAVKSQTISCPLASLQLAYATQYELPVVRYFNNQAQGILTTTSVKTLTPVAVTASSIASGSSVLQKPLDITLQTDKPLQAIGAVSLVAKNSNNTETVIPVTPKIEGQTINIAFSKELARKTSFQLHIASLTAQDGSGLATKSLTIPFSTSGGPVVKGANIGSRNIAQGQTIQLTFDQTLLPNQDVAAIVSFIVGGQPQPAAFSIAGNKLSIKPAAALPLCAPFTIKLSAAIQSEFGISGDSTYSVNSRAICYTTFSIGSSIRGRAITAYRFGSGPNPIIYLGGMHGSESNSRSIMTEWFNELNANPQRLGSRSLVVIPGVNPDGLASGSRLNAHNVDLNRNFPASDWKSIVTSPQSPTPSPAGGPTPLSEPESRAVASYIQQTQPRLVMSFHSAAAVVEANEAGDSTAIASVYAAKARYRAIPKSQSAPVFQYDTTGAMEDWMRSSLGKPAIVVELLSRTSSEFGRNRDALWYTTGL